MGLVHDLGVVGLVNFERAALRIVVERITSAIHGGTGFSLLRLGAGEGPMLCWPRRQDRAEIELQVWFGRTDFTDSELSTIGDGLREAVRSADVVGLPTDFQLGVDPRYGRVAEGIRSFDLCSPRQLFTDANIHWYLQWSGAIGCLLHGLDHIDVIGCRSIGPLIAGAFRIGSVRTQLVRGEHSFPGSITRPHWPDGYAEVMNQLETIAAGDVFLVGAGVLGKIYCHRIKEKGGVALDVGSLLDGWANVPSRKRYQSGSRAFTLDHVGSIQTDWDDMQKRLVRHLAEFDIRDATY